MNYRIAAFVMFCFVALVFTAGCTQTTSVATPTPTQTPTATPGAVESTAVPTVAATAEVLTVIPADRAVEFTLEKDRVYGTITLTFTGGPGQIYIKKVWMNVTRSDGEVVSDTMKFSGSQIGKGDSLEIKGTHGADQVQAFVSISGVPYKIKDETLGGQEFYKS
ncbi:MAG: hypothetical protein ABFC24_04665 [Methanoregulaceae archaeon]